MTKKQKCIFLDRDGVINKDKVDYVYKPEELFIIEGVPQALKAFKENGYLIVIITNQSGIAKGIYKKENVIEIHNLVQAATENSLDDIYMAPYHETYHNSLSRKPGSLMFEKAISKHNIDLSQSWMIGDKERDLIPAKKLGIKTILVDNKKETPFADYSTENLLSASNIILK
jgi:D-glycero-D-manno-heptose 1,7-bisphosphate phosphatase